MGLIRLDTQREFLEGSFTNLIRDGRGNIRPKPNNLLPNQYLNEIAPDGEPLFYNLAWNIKKVIAHHINVSMPGVANSRSLTRQTSSATPLSEGSWTMQSPWVPGDPKSGEGIKPLPPELETIATGLAGYEPGTYGIAFGKSSEWGPTTLTGIVYVTLVAGQAPIITVPDWVRDPRVASLDVYMTRKGGGTATLALLRKFPVSEIRSDKLTVPGPWRNRGRAPTSNQSGVPVPPRPEKDKDFRERPSLNDTAVGSWEAATQLALGEGRGLVSAWSKPQQVKGTWKLVKKPGPGDKNPPKPQDAIDSANAIELNMAPDAPDARMQAPGKRPDADYSYMGEEVDAEESYLIGRINLVRRENGLPNLVLNQKLNRTAYKKVTGHGWSVARIARHEGYDGKIQDISTPAESADAFFDSLDDSTYLRADYEAVGVAREAGQWLLILADDAELVESASEICQFVDKNGNVTERHVTEDGEFRAAVSLGWDLVDGTNMNYSYSGSFGTNVSTAMGRIHALGRVSCQSTGGQVVISDAALEAGVAARTYSDGRIVLSTASNTFTTGSATLRNTAVIHEGFHGLGFGHTPEPSVLRTPVSVASETPTSYDISEYTRVYGTPTEPGGGQTPTPTTPGEPEKRQPDDTTPEPPPEWHREWVRDTVKKNTALFVRWPRVLRRHRKLSGTAWLRHTDSAGVVTTYRVYPAYGREGVAGYFKPRGEFERGVVVPGVLPDAAVELNKRGLGPSARLVQEDLPTEDTTILDPPDPTSIPDTPELTSATGPSGRLLATVTGVYEDGTHTKMSEPGKNASGNPYIDVPVGSILKVLPPTTLNRLKNAEWAQRDGAGTPLDWTLTGKDATTLLDVRDGTLYMSTTALTNTSMALTSRALSVDPSKPLTIGGTLGANSVAGRTRVGTVEVLMRELNGSRAQIGTDLTIVSATNEADFFETFFAGEARQLNAATAFVQVVVRTAGVTKDLEGYFRNIRVLDLPSDVRKLSDVAETRFEPDPGTPLPAGSYIAAGPAPAPKGVVVEPEPPLDLLTFEDGTFPGWTASGLGAIQTTAPITGTRSYRVERTLVTQSQAGNLSRAFPALFGKSIASRAIYKWNQIPTNGYAVFHHMQQDGGFSTCWLRLDAYGQLFVDTRPGTGAIVYTYFTGVIVPSGTTLDVELAFAPGAQGFLSLGVGLNGARRAQVWSGSFNFSGRTAHIPFVGVLNLSDTRALYNVDIDQVVVTKNGDIPDRERAQSASQLGQDPVDAPLRSDPAWTPKTLLTTGFIRRPTTRNGHRYTSSVGTTGPNEPAFPTGSMSTVRDNAGLVAVARSTAYTLGASVLKPSGTLADAQWYEVTGFTVGSSGSTASTPPAYPATGTVTDGGVIFTARDTVVWTEAGSDARMFDSNGKSIGQIYALVLEGAATPDNPAIVPLLEDSVPVFPNATYTLASFLRSTPFVTDPSYLQVWLKSEAGELEPVLVNSLPLPTTERGWHAAAQSDDYTTFTVLPGYDLVDVTLSLQPGVHVLQEPALFEGAITSFSARDALRGFGAASVASAEFVIDLKPELYELGIQPGVFVSEFGVKTEDPDLENPAGTLLANFSQSDNRITYRPYADPPLGGMGTMSRYLKATLDFIGDGTVSGSAVIPDGGIFARTWQPVGLLLREDGSNFPGVAYVSPLASSSTYPDVEVRRVGGKLVLVKKSEDIERIETGLRVEVSTEEAKREIEYFSSIGPLRLEIPHAGGTVAGAAYMIVCDGGIRMEPMGVPSRIHDSNRVYFATGNIEYAEVLESAPLQPPMHRLLV